MPKKISLAIALILFGVFAAIAAGVALNSDVYLVSTKYILAYLGVPCALAVTGLAAVVFARYRAAILANLCGVLVAILAAEFGVEFLSESTNNTIIRTDAMSEAASKRGETFDRRNPSEVLSDLRASGRDAYPVWSPTQFLMSAANPASYAGPFKIDGDRPVFPLTSVANATSVYCNEGGKRLVFASDRYGFNNPDDVWSGVPAEIVLLGDSFAQGACVPPDRNAAALLRGAGLRALTLGVGGTGPLIQLAVLREYGPIARPKHVFWLFYEANDMHINLSLESKFPILNAYIGDGDGWRQNLPELQPKTDILLRALIDSRLSEISRNETETRKPTYGAIEHFKLQALRQRSGLTSCPTKRQQFDALRAIYATARKTVDAWGGSLTVIYLPGSDPACDLFDGATENEGWMRAGVEGATRGAGIKFVDLTPALRNGGQYGENFYYPGSHYSAAGYKKLSELILRQLRTN